MELVDLLKKKYFTQRVQIDRYYHTKKGEFDFK